ncbi:MAG: hypothetical protein M5U01_26120 [Ardenticatenaceae bacterium]|nr:hypothetical protein [Ardenticatenaceae bacterium]HBY98389.1 hypothetical protein [Chloroflexota bacterium]
MLEWQDARATQAEVFHGTVTVARPRTLVRVNLRKLLIFSASLFFFIIAVDLMKEGARGLAPLVTTFTRTGSPTTSLGFGWLFAYVVMSGSPVAAAALTFFDAGVIDKLGAFAMINGSRLGASFIVLFIGFLYILRGKGKRESLSMGLLALTVTGTIYALGALIGVLLLNSPGIANVQIPTGVALSSALDVVLGPMVHLLKGALPSWALFPAGLVIIMLSFGLFDQSLPKLQLNGHRRLTRIVSNPLAMFFLGLGLTTISMSVSISLSILVPLSAKGLVRREHVIPYIMGANISTLIDTLFASILLNNPAAFTIIFVGMLSVTLASLLVLLLAYRRYERMILATVEWIMGRNRNLAIFMVTIFALPLLMLILK